MLLHVLAHDNIATERQCSREEQSQSLPEDDLVSLFKKRLDHTDLG